MAHSESKLRFSIREWGKNKHHKPVNMQLLPTDRSGTSDERRRLESKIQHLEEELDDEQATTETLNERLRRSVQEVIGFCSSL